MSTSKRKAFTLIEMLIVIVIIGVLAAALIPRLLSVQERARDTRRKTDLQQIANALEIYKADNTTYPPPTYYNNQNNLCSGVDVNLYPGCNNSSAMTNPRLHRLTTSYISSQPVDPLNANKGSVGWGSVLDGPWFLQRFFYSYVGDTKRYSLVARLENRNDPDRCSVKNRQVRWSDGLATRFCATMSRPDFVSNGGVNIDSPPLYVLSY